MIEASSVADATLLSAVESLRSQTRTLSRAVRIIEKLVDAAVVSGDTTIEEDASTTIGFPVPQTTPEARRIGRT